MEGSGLAFRRRFWGWSVGFTLRQAREIFLGGWRWPTIRGSLPAFALQASAYIETSAWHFFASRKNGARYRFRTCDPHRVKEGITHRLISAHCDDTLRKAVIKRAFAFGLVHNFLIEPAIRG